jgi:hypothetical protein
MNAKRSEAITVITAFLLKSSLHTAPMNHFNSRRLCRTPARGYTTSESLLPCRASAEEGAGEAKDSSSDTKMIRTAQGTMSEAEALALFKMADFTPPAGVSTQEAYDMLQQRGKGLSLERDTSKEEAAAVKLTAVGTLLVLKS